MEMLRGLWVSIDLMFRTDGGRNKGGALRIVAMGAGGKKWLELGRFLKMQLRATKNKKRQAKSVKESQAYCSVVCGRSQ